MLSSNLFSDILINPAQNGANHLYIVSGYATPAMTFHHFQALNKQKVHINLHLIVGMIPQAGLSQSNHQGFQKLVQDDLAGQFDCHYVISPPPVHSKVYVWCNEDQPTKAFIGSANYSQRAFGKSQREVMSSCDPQQGFAYFHSLLDDTVPCKHPNAENVVQRFDNKYRTRRERHIEHDKSDSLHQTSGFEHVCVSFINRSGDISGRSGLNWGQRPEQKREPNQAYIPLKSHLYKTEFFPPIGQHFTVRTDDNQVLICTRAQQSGKAIHTPHNNSLIGRYFRDRLGVADGKLVVMSDFIRYGRTDIDFHKIDDETYLMDFSPPNN